MSDAPRALTADQQSVADRVIRDLAGPDASLREDQLTAVAGLLAPGARVLVVQATGWGKSAVYWTATALLRAAGAGPTLVISPLLSLMRDQVAAAGRAGLRAATLNSSNTDEWSEIERQLAGGDLDVVLVSPERLANPRFGRRILDQLVGRLGMVVIDEAHAVSDWGHDFRPDYRRVSDTIRSLSPQTPVLATTATANERVTADVAHQLGAQTLVLRGPLARTSLELAVIDRLTPSSATPGWSSSCRTCRDRASCTPSRWPMPSGWPRRSRPDTVPRCRWRRTPASSTATNASDARRLCAETS